MATQYGGAGALRFTAGGDGIVDRLQVSLRRIPEVGATCWDGELSPLNADDLSFLQ